jgi:hypothetical protein
MIKKIILNLVIVGVVVFVLDFATGRTLRYFYFKQTSGFDFRTKYSMESTEADILVFGSSRANHHYVPEVFEDSLKMTFYNTGRDAAGILYQTGVLRSVLKRYTPKLIILDYSDDFNKKENANDRPSALLPYYRTHEEVRKIIELNNPFERIKLISEIYPFNSRILSTSIGNLEINKKRNADNNGYVPFYGEWQADVDSIGTYQPYEVDSNKVIAFRELISTAKKSNAKVVVIYSPAFQKIKKSQEIEICNEICSVENVPFWDFSKDTIFLNNRHLFQDVGHLNHNGAKILSYLVVDKIKHNIYNTHSNMGIKMQ